MSALSLKTLLVPEKPATLEYPGMPGFKIEVAFLSRETLQKMRKKATKTTFKNRQPVEELNDDLFLQLYVQATIKGWSGLKLKYLEQLAPVDLADADREEELPYSEEDALDLMKASVNFDAFISEKASDLGEFSTNKSS
jgi:hypothetical protein